MSEFETDLMGYDKIVEQSMRGVVCNVIKKIAKEGLPGEHSIFIIFKTDHKGVVLSERVKVQYPESIKIVLQNQFKITKVTPKYFDITLSFSGVEEKVKIPFDAVLEFTDPHTRFSLNFDTKLNITEAELEEFMEEYDEYAQHEDGDSELENYKDGDKNEENKVICLETAKKNLRNQMDNKKK